VGTLSLNTVGTHMSNLYAWRPPAGSHRILVMPFHLPALDHDVMDLSAGAITGQW
jgi:hypothetical protein